MRCADGRDPLPGPMHDSHARLKVVNSKPATSCLQGDSMRLFLTMIFAIGVNGHAFAQAAQAKTLSVFNNRHFTPVKDVVTPSSDYYTFISTSNSNTSLLAGH